MEEKNLCRDFCGSPQTVVTKWREGVETKIRKRKRQRKMRNRESGGRMCVSVCEWE